MADFLEIHLMQYSDWCNDTPANSLGIHIASIIHNRHTFLAIPWGNSDKHFGCLVALT